MTPCRVHASGLACGSAVPVAPNVVLLTVDATRDAFQDLLVYDPTSGDARLMAGTAAGTFVDAGMTSALGANAALASGDFDGDGTTDVLTTIPEDGTMSFTNLGTGGPPRPLPTLLRGWIWRPARLDGDAFVDLIGYRPDTGAIMPVLNSRSGFTPLAPIAAAAARTLLVSDVNGDGRSDVVLYDRGTGVVTVGIATPAGFEVSHTAARPGMLVLSHASQP